MAKKFMCEDGFMVQSPREDEVVDMAMAHMRKMHPEMKTKKEDVQMKMTDA